MQAVHEGWATIGVSSPVAEQVTGLRRKRIGKIRLVPVCSRTHPLAGVKAPIPLSVLAGEQQIVLGDKSALTRGLDLAVLSARTLRVADLGTKLELIAAGLG